VVGEDKVVSPLAGSDEHLPSRAPLRVEGDRGAILERPAGAARGSWFYFRTDVDGATGLYRRGYGGTSSRQSHRGPSDVHQRVLAVTDLARNEVLVTRETLGTPPNYFLLRGARTTQLTDYKSSYTALAGTRRRKLTYTRKDGVRLSAMLYLPPGYRDGERLPTVFWIYPSEYTDEKSVPVVETQRYWNIVGASRFALLLGGYALVDHPGMPIIGPPGKQSDAYLTQLIDSAEAAVNHVVDIGVAAPDRMAVAGRSYGAFSAANLLVHTDLFRTAVAMSGAYNRTLTPFGFQSEQRSFWEATEQYTRISPFFYAHHFKRPILLIHGQNDDNPGTLPMQSERFFQALAGNGAPVRYVSMPFEGHHYRAKESIDHIAQEMLNWLDRHLVASQARTQG
jgi:dipeptidyl aminopeptidase/acylaminoacyl peptidase